MLKNYFKTAFRNLWRNKNFTFINIAGLAVGIAVCLTIFLIIQFEKSFDVYHANKDRIYRVLTERKNADGVRSTAGVPYPLPTMMHQEFPDMPSTGIYSRRDEQVIISGDNTNLPVKKFKEENGTFFAEPDIFKIFDFTMLGGDYAALKDPYTMLLSRSAAEKYFNDWQLAIGKSIRLSDQGLYKVIGVLEDVPLNSDFQIKILASYASQKQFPTIGWNNVTSNHGCYILLPKGTTPASIDNQLKVLMKKYIKDEDYNGRQWVQSVSMAHFDEVAGNFSDRTISPRMINTLWLIAAFILLIACVNFVNLSTAQAVKRAKEVSVRKVLGSNRQQLRLQFFSETAIITLVAILLSIGITALCLPYISSILELSLTIKLIHDRSVYLFLGLTAAAVILLAGFYPAIVLSRFNAVTALKSKVTAGRSKGISLRRGLVVFQFVVAQALIIGTLIIVQQMDYFKNHPMGFNKDAVVNVTFPDDSISKTRLDYLKTRLMNIKGVQSVSFSFASPADNTNWSSNFKYDNADKETDWNANLKWADADYIKTYDLTLVAGRDLQKSDTAREFLVNETLVKRLGISNPNEILNHDINLWGQMKFKVVGVIKDFHAMSLRQALVPVLVSTRSDFYQTAGIKLSTVDIASTMKNVEHLWNEVYPDFVYEQLFLDDKVQSFYSEENKLSDLYKIFAGLAIFLSCLGLYGLASFMAVQKVKEVGIRKVLGASVNNIVLLFSKEFLVLIGIAFLIAVPLAWYFMNDWLKDFVYRIGISWWIVALAGAIAVIIALITISVKAVKAALANPIKSLRTE